MVPQLTDWGSTSVRTTTKTNVLLVFEHKSARAAAAAAAVVWLTRVNQPPYLGFFVGGHRFAECFKLQLADYGRCAHHDPPHNLQDDSQHQPHALRAERGISCASRPGFIQTTGAVVHVWELIDNCAHSLLVSCSSPDKGKPQVNVGFSNEKERGRVGFATHVTGDKTALSASNMLYGQRRVTLLLPVAVLL